MTIWLLALLLLASLAGLGYRQGAIRVACSLVGILLAALLAAPLGHLLKRPLMAIGLSNPVLVWVVGPLVMFLAVSMAFKIAAFALHRKIEVYYKYKAGELRLALWERLNHRLGLCLGLVNGTLYLLLISWAIYAFSYWTTQVAASDNEPRMVRILNRLGQDLQSSGLAKAARALDRMPEAYYDMADLTGLIYANPLCEARLQRYPAFLGLAERPEIQDITSDNSLTELWMKQEPLQTLMAQPKIQTVFNNPDLLKDLWGTVIENRADLRAYLETGRSPKYASEPILGRWDFNISAALRFILLSRQNITSKEMRELKRSIGPAFAKTTLVATTEHKVILKDLPPIRSTGVVGPPQTHPGEWKNLDGKYQLSLSSGGENEEIAATVEGDRLTLKRAGMDLVFDRED
jgi:uncharacterized membrane protein required for colicin V production